MCGLAGILKDEPLEESTEKLLERMGMAIFNRGPDSSGVWTEKINGIGLVHRRLAILDLTEAGHQPMLSGTGRYVLAFNGEIYNHLEVRAELESLAARTWRGHSDTETLLAAIEVWGLEDTLKRCIGMFAIALWDTAEKKLSLARDRFGEKPLYYGICSNSTLLFGSELKSFLVHPSFKPIIDRNSLAQYLRYNYVPSPKSIYKDVFKVEPATIVQFDSTLKIVKKLCYWSMVDKILDGRSNQYPDAKVAITELETALKLTINEQMLADVPLGAFLSGGVDSSLIVSLMQNQSKIPVRTFSIGFEEEEYNEADFAAAVAKHLGTEHTEFVATAEDALIIVDKIAQIYDEPFSDSSQIPTFIVSELAKKYVTVCLSGDAGDELFCGYNRYLMTEKVWSFLSKFPIFVRRAMASFIRSISIDSWNRFNKLLPAKYKMSNLGDKLHKSANVIIAKDLRQLYQRLTSIWQNPEVVVIGSTIDNIVDNESSLENLDSISWMMATDTMTYMSGDILTKVDRAAMAVSLETRVPFLDHRIFELAWRIPLQHKINKGQGKIPLRKVLYKYVPKELIERPKTGFAVPVAEWLRGGLKPWAEKLLEANRIQEEGFFDSKVVSKMWKEHQDGSRNWHYQLWAILMFQNWFEKNHK